MANRLIIFVTLCVALAGCDTEAMQREADLAAQCKSARTYGESYGTPENRGPCWLYTTSHSVMGNIQSFTVRVRGTEYGVAALTYQGKRLISASQAF